MRASVVGAGGPEVFVSGAQTARQSPPSPPRGGRLRIPDRAAIPEEAEDDEAEEADARRIVCATDSLFVFASFLWVDSLLSKRVNRFRSALSA